MLQQVINMTVESTGAFTSAHHKIISFEILLIRCMYMFMLFRVLYLDISSTKSETFLVSLTHAIKARNKQFQFFSLCYVSST